MSGYGVRKPTEGLPLFDRQSQEREEQTRQLARVENNIADSVLEFCRLKSHRTFCVTELAAFVARKHGGAPASADRILRELRKKKRVNYRVVSRSQSRYEILSVEGAA